MDDSVLGAVEVSLPTSLAGIADHTYTPSELEPLAGFLGSHARADESKLQTIADFFRSGKTEFSDIDLLQAVRHLETKLGTPKIGEKRIDMVYRYVKLQGQIDSISKERDALLR